MYYASVLADSLSPEGMRLTTFEIRLPRIVLAEFNTHRMLSRNSASSRAVPISVTIQGVEDDPFFPASFGGHQTGMQAAAPIDEQEEARQVWHDALEDAVGHAKALQALGVYKGLGNRLVEPFKWHTIIATATDWSNYFALRTDKNAQDEIRIVSEMMQKCYEDSTPRQLGYGEYHIPLVTSAEFMESQDYGFWVPVSIGRCARVSFERQHDDDVDKAIAIHDRLMENTNRHLSPFEHVARPFDPNEWDVINQFLPENPDFKVSTAFWNSRAHNLEYAGNLRGWWSARMDVLDENDYGKVLASSSN